MRNRSPATGNTCCLKLALPLPPLPHTIGNRGIGIDLGDWSFPSPPPIYDPPNVGTTPNPSGNPDPSDPFSGPIWQEGGPQILSNLADLLLPVDPACEFAYCGGLGITGGLPTSYKQCTQESDEVNGGFLSKADEVGAFGASAGVAAFAAKLLHLGTEHGVVYGTETLSETTATNLRKIIDGTDPRFTAPGPLSKQLASAEATEAASSLIGKASYLFFAAATVFSAVARAACYIQFGGY